MQNTVDQLPIFNGRRISMVATAGQWYVAIKPICEGLDVDYIQQFKNLKDDGILGQLLCEHTMVAADGKLRKMTCLPEKFIYGWLFSIRSDSPQLIEYKRVCYELMYNHFHGALTGRVGIITERSAIDVEIEALEQKMTESPDYQRIQELKNRKTQLGRELSKQVKNYDTSLVAVQGSLFPATS